MAFAQHLIFIARQPCLENLFGVDLEESVCALDLLGSIPPEFSKQLNLLNN